MKLGGRADLALPDKARYLGPTSNSGPSFCVLLGTHFAFHDHRSLIIRVFFLGKLHLRDDLFAAAYST